MSVHTQQENWQVERGAATAGPQVALDPAPHIEVGISLGAPKDLLLASVRAFGTSSIKGVTNLVPAPYQSPHAIAQHTSFDYSSDHCRVLDTCSTRTPIACAYATSLPSQTAACFHMVGLMVCCVSALVRC